MSQDFEILNYPWDENGYRPKTTVNLSLTENSLILKFVSYQTEIRAVQTENNTDVYRDSCMEMYAQFAPDTDNRYMNFEVNPNGAVYCSKGSCRENCIKIASDVIDTFDAQTKVFSDRWEAKLTIPSEFIKKEIPSYQHKAGQIIRANFYKCGDDAKYPHYGCWSNIKWDYPDFHRPEFFSEIRLV